MPDDEIPIEDGTVRLAQGIVVRNGAPRALSPREQSILVRLVQAQGASVDREALADAMGDGARPRSVDFAVRRLRAKLEVDPSTPRHVLTHHGAGYRFVPLQRGLPAPARAGRRLRLDDGWVDVDSGVVQRGEARAVLTGKELEILQRLWTSAPAPVSREVLARDVWGRRATSALRYVDQVVHRLRTKLEIQPSAPRTILTVPRVGVALAPEPAVAAALGPELSSFVGREEELATLADLGARHRLITLLGPAGIGKTRLAREHAARARDAGSEVWFCDVQHRGEATVGDLA